MHVRSAGSAPADEINPAVRAKVMITMGCGDTCPVHPGKRYLDWELTDPAGKGIDAVRPIRDIDARVRGLLSELGVAPSAATPEGSTQ